MLLAAWVIATITRPLRQLSQAVAAVSNDGLSAASLDQHLNARSADSLRDTFGPLAVGFRAMRPRCARSGARCNGSTTFAVKA